MSPDAPPFIRRLRRFLEASRGERWAATWSVPAPAAPADLEVLAADLGHGVSADHRQVLLHWDGLGLGFYTFLAATPRSGLATIADRQRAAAFLHEDGHAGATLIACNARGLVYLETAQGAIYSLTADGDAIRLVARSWSELVDRLVSEEAGRW